LKRSAYMFPYKTAVVHGDRRYTYQEFEERVNRLASRLRGEGFQKGDRIAFLCPNIPPMLEAHFAVPAAGLVLVAINTRLSAGEVEYIIEHAKSKMVFVDAELEELIENVDESVEVVRVEDSGEEGDPYEDYLAEGSPEPVESVLEDEEETISVNYTSGTTGQPKGVMYSQRGAYISALGNVIETQMNYETRYLWTLPMFHCNGWTFTWAVTAIAGTHVCLRKVEPAKIWELFKSEEITPRARPKGHRLHRRLRAIARPAWRPPRAEYPPYPPLRPDRDLRAHNHERPARGVGGARPRGAREAAGAAGTGLRHRRPGEGRGRRYERRAARRGDDRRDRYARQYGHEGLPRQ
jgi:AMP-binding enzyme